MSNKQWEKVGRAIADVAPGLGALFGGPAGAAIGTLVSATLGTKADPDAVMTKLKADPEALLKIAQLEKDERDNIRNWQLESVRVALADVQDARKHHAGHWMPSAITIGSAIMVTAIGIALLTLPIPEANRDMAVYLFGQVTTVFTGSVAYWIGTSRSSADKNTLLNTKEYL